MLNSKCILIEVLLIFMTGVLLTVEFCAVFDHMVSFKFDLKDSCIKIAKEKEKKRKKSFD